MDSHGETGQGVGRSGGGSERNSDLSWVMRKQGEVEGAEDPMPSHRMGGAAVISKEDNGVKCRLWCTWVAGPRHTGGHWAKLHTGIVCCVFPVTQQHGSHRELSFGLETWIASYKVSKNQEVWILCKFDCKWNCLCSWIQSFHIIPKQMSRPLKKYSHIKYT